MSQIKLRRTITFKQTVKATLPTENPDVFGEISFIAEYRLLTNDELSEMVAANLGVKEQLDRVLIGVEKLPCAEEQPFSPEEALALVKDNTILSMAALHTFNKAASKDIVGKTAKTSSAH